MAGNMNVLAAVNMRVNASANFDYVVTRGYEVIDLISNADATAGGAATVTPQRQPAAGGGFTAFGAALTVTTVSLIVYASTIVPAQNTFAVGDTMRFVGDQATMDAFVTAVVIPTSWIAG